MKKFPDKIFFQTVDPQFCSPAFVFDHINLSIAFLDFTESNVVSSKKWIQ